MTPLLLVVYNYSEFDLHSSILSLSSNANNSRASSTLFAPRIMSARASLLLPFCMPEERVSASSLSYLPCFSALLAVARMKGEVEEALVLGLEDEAS